MKKIICCISIFTLVSCATGYKPNSFWNDGGFKETEIQPNLFQVKFNGNEFTSRERSADFATLRAADLCLSRRLNYLVINNIDTIERRTAVIPGSSSTSSYGSGYGNATSRVIGNSIYTTGSSSHSSSSYTTYTPPTELYSPKTGLTVRCFPDNINGSWDAKYLANALKIKYGIESSRIKPKRNNERSIYPSRYR